MLTYQDFEKATDKVAFITQLIGEYRNSEFYKVAEEAELYNKQKNVTINEYVRRIFTLAGAPIEDFTASNNKLASNFFRRLNTQRCTYSLGNGVSFNKTDTKKKLGEDFDTRIFDLGYDALIHAVSYGFWNLDRLYVFPMLEFAPLWDEEDGQLKAGVRFWQLHKSKPMMAVLYEIDGYTKYRAESGGAFQIIQEKKAYKTKIAYTEAGDVEVVGVENYSALPVIPMWGSKLHQSTLVGMKSSIDSFDLIRSGFANDLTDCSEIYWLIENCGGMTDEDLSRFRDKLKIMHIAEVDGDSGAKATPYTQEIPFNARNAYLELIRNGIYEDFGGLDVHTIAAGATNDHIDAAYQPMDENADDFEYNVIEFIQQLLRIIGIEDYPLFKRNRISNEMEQTQMVLSAAQFLDEETVLNKLPFITVDEVKAIMKKAQAEADDRYEDEQGYDEEEEQEGQEAEE